MPKSRTAGSYGSSVFSFLSTYILFSVLVVPIYILTNSVGTFLFLHTHSSICYVSYLLFDGHSDWCEVVAHSSFDLHFSSDVECFFMCLLATGISVLEKCLFRSFAHFSTGLLGVLLLSCISCLYILEMKPMSVA